MEYTHILLWTVTRWRFVFAAENKDRESVMKTKSSIFQRHINANEEVKTFKAKIARLEKELDNARIKAELYNKMINVAERHFNIHIRKKLVLSST